MNAEMLHQIIDLIARRFDPNRVILFGSQAAESADAGSDIDLLVISDKAASQREQALAIRRSLAQFPVACDIIVKSPGDYVRLRRVVNNIVYLADRYGKVVYER